MGDSYVLEECKYKALWEERQRYRRVDKGSKDALAYYFIQGFHVILKIHSSEFGWHWDQVIIIHIKFTLILDHRS